MQGNRFFPFLLLSNLLKNIFFYLFIFLSLITFLLYVQFFVNITATRVACSCSPASWKCACLRSFVRSFVRSCARRRTARSTVTNRKLLCTVRQWHRSLSLSLYTYIFMYIYLYSPAILSYFVLRRLIDALSPRPCCWFSSSSSENFLISCSIFFKFYDGIIATTSSSIVQKIVKSVGCCSQLRLVDVVTSLANQMRVGCDNNSNRSE